MFRKTLSTIAGLALSVCLASSAFAAAFANFDLIRVVSDSSGGSTLEIVTDLGDVRTLAALSNTKVGGGGDAFTNFNLNPLANLSVNYYAVNRTSVLNGTMYIGANITTAPITGGVPQIQNSLSITIPATSPISVNKYYASLPLAAGSASTVIANNIAAGSFGATFGSTTLGAYNGYAGLTWASLTNLSLANIATTPVPMAVWRFGAETGTNMNSQLTGVKILDLTTNADGSTTINPVVAKSNQTIGAITFTPPTLAVGGSTTASATATSGLTVTFGATVASSSVCSVTSAGVVTALAAGVCTVTADQPGNASWNPAPQLTQNISVLTPQAIGPITFLPPNLTVTKTSTASAVANSGLAVSFGTTTPTVCTVSGLNNSIVTGSGLGICTITADQAGDAVTFVAAASQVTQNINVIDPFIKINTATVPDNTLNAALTIPTADATIYLQAAPLFVENVLMSNPVNIQLRGGYTDALFTSQTSFSIIKGSLTVKAGALKVTNLIVQQ